MSDLIEQVEDRLADFTRDKRVLVLSWMALIIGALSAVVAYALVWLIAVITNLAFYRRWSSVFQFPDHHHLGYSMLLVPVIGGLIIGLMARYGSEKIRGHGIPEALEAILFGRSEMEPKVALLKPLSSRSRSAPAGPSARWDRFSRSFFTSRPQNARHFWSPVLRAAWRRSSLHRFLRRYLRSSCCCLNGGPGRLFRWPSQPSPHPLFACRFSARA